MNKIFTAMGNLDDDLLTMAMTDKVRAGPALWARGLAIATAAAVVISGGVYLGVRYWNAGGVEEFSIGFSEPRLQFSGGDFNRVAVKVEALQPIDNVRFTVSYGWDGFDVSVFDHEDFRNKIEYHEILLTMQAEGWNLDKGEYEWGQKHIIKNIDLKEYQSEDYHVNSNLEELMKNYKENQKEEIVYQFNHCEEITIPAEMFNSEIGGVCIELYAHYTDRLYEEYEDEIHGGDYVIIWYKVEGDQVRLGDYSVVGETEEKLFYEYDRRYHKFSVSDN